MGKELYVGILEIEKEGLREHPFSSHKTSYGSPTPPIIFGAWAFPRLRILCKRFVVTLQLFACSLCAFLIFYLLICPAITTPTTVRQIRLTVHHGNLRYADPTVENRLWQEFSVFFGPFSFSSIFAFFKYLIPIFNSKEESTSECPPSFIIIIILGECEVRSIWSDCTRTGIWVSTTAWNFLHKSLLYIDEDIYIYIWYKVIFSTKIFILNHIDI